MIRPLRRPLSKPLVRPSLHSTTSLTPTTNINGLDIANADIVAWLEASPTVTLPQLFKDGWSSPSSGDANMVAVYDGDIDASTSKRAFVGVQAGEIPIEGARRVDHADGQDYSFGALGIEYLSTKADGTTPIPDISGIVVQDESTNRVLNADGTGWTAQNVTLTTGQSLGEIDGFTIESNATSGQHRAFVTISALNNPHRCGRSVVIEALNGTGFAQISSAGSSYANIDMSDGSVPQSANMNISTRFLGDSKVEVHLSETVDRGATINYFIVTLIENGTDGKDASHGTSGLKLGIYGVTLDANSGGSTPLPPGIINNTTGSTLTRTAAQAPLDISAADLGTSHTILVAYEQPEVWPGAGHKILATDGSETIFETAATSGVLRTVVGGFSQEWPAGSTVAGDINRVAITTDGAGGLRGCTNGGTVLQSTQSTYNPTYGAQKLGHDGSGNYSHFAVQQLLESSGQLTDVELQDITS